MMGIRLACLPLAVVTTGWVRWAFILGAVVLPYIAVVIANAASRPQHGTLVPPAEHEGRRQLLASPTKRETSSQA